MKGSVRLNRKKLNVREAKKTDPFEVFGHGVIAYFDLMRMILLILSILSILSLPLIYYYGTGTAFKNSTTYLWSQWSMGNIGFADS
jgi:hypothetical protein